MRISPDRTVRRYVPILKGKEGEYSALQELSARHKAVMQPMFEIPDVPYDYLNERPAKSLDEHLGNVAKRIDDAWSENRPVFLDLRWISQTEMMEDGQHPLEHITQTSSEVGLSIVPVTGLRRLRQYQEAVRAAARTMDLGVCLRVTQEDIGDEEDDDLASKVERLILYLGCEKRNTDLLLDFEDLVALPFSQVRRLARSTLADLPTISEWRSLTLAASSFPENLSGIERDTEERIPRREWEMWTALARRPDRLQDERVPDFGDYGISHPAPPEIDPRVMRMSASIRYTLEDGWLVLKGLNVRDYGFAQYHDLCRNLVRLPEYRGEDFSWGDAYIMKCAERSVGPGNATTWRKVGTNHHLAVVAEQIATWTAEP